MKIKRFPAAVLAAALALFASSCKDPSPENLLNKDQPVSITVWHYYNGVQQTQFDDMVAEFNNTVGSEKGVYVKAFTKNSVSELAQSVLSSVNDEAGAGPLPDIFATYAETAYQADAAGKLADLNAYFTAEEKAEYVDEYIKEGDFGGTFKIFPTAKSTEVFIMNTTDWQDFAAKNGVSYDDLSTWEGLRAVAEKYYNYTDAKTPDIENDGKAFFGRDAVANYMLIGAKQLGASFAKPDESGKYTVSSDKTAVKKLWDNFYVPFISGYYAAESRFRSDDAKTGAIISMVCSTTGAAYFPSEVTIDDDTTYPIDYIVLSVPNFQNTSPCVVQQGAGMCVTKSEARKEYACAVFLKWFTEKDRNIDFSINSGYLPVKKSANDISAIEQKSEKISPIMKRTIETAINEINGYSLYTSPPYDNSDAVRSFIGSYIENSAKEDRAAVLEKINSGASRKAVLAEFTSSSAFEKWYSEFEKGLEKAANNNI